MNPVKDFEELCSLRNLKPSLLCTPPDLKDCKCRKYRDFVRLKSYLRIVGKFRTCFGAFRNFPGALDREECKYSECRAMFWTQVLSKNVSDVFFFVSKVFVVFWAGSKLTS